VQSDPWRERRLAAGRRPDGGDISECSPGRPLPLAALRNPYGPSGGATIMACCSLDSSPSAFLEAICHASKAAWFPEARPALEACPAGQSRPGCASTLAGKAASQPTAGRAWALQELSQSLKLHGLKWLSMAGAAEEPVVGQFYDPS